MTKQTCAECGRRIEYVDGWRHLTTVAGLEADANHSAVARAAQIEADADYADQLGCDEVRRDEAAR